MLLYHSIFVKQSDIPPPNGHNARIRALNARIRAPDVAIGLAEAGTSNFFAISGRTDLRIGVSEAKFDVEPDFDVKKSPTPPKSAKNHDKPNKNREANSKETFFFIDFVFDSESFETPFGEVLQVKNCK